MFLDIIILLLRTPAVRPVSFRLEILTKGSGSKMENTAMQVWETNLLRQSSNLLDH